MIKDLFVVFSLLISFSLVSALPGDLDTTFGVSGGYVVSDFAGAQIDERHKDSAIQADGKIVAVGQTYIIAVSSKRFGFGEPSRVLVVNEAVTDADFIAME